MMWSYSKRLAYMMANSANESEKRRQKHVRESMIKK